jgi:hypothetical protein
MAFGFDEEKGEFIEVRGQKFYKQETKPETWQKIAPSWDQYLKQRGTSQEEVNKLPPDVATGKFYQPFTELVSGQKLPTEQIKDSRVRREREEKQKSLEERSKKAFSAAERDQIAKESQESKLVTPDRKTMQNLVLERELTTQTPALTEPMPGEPMTEQAAPIAPAAPAMPSVMQAQTTQTQRTMPGPEYKAAMGAFEKATEEVQKTSMAQANLEIEKQKQIGAETMRVQQLYEDDLISVESERLMRENAIQKQRDKYNAAVQAKENFEYKDFFEGRTGAKVMAGIAMALGTVGAALTKGENVAYKVIQNAIDQDFAMQKAEHDKLKGTVEDTRNLYTQLVNQGLDELQADVAFSEIKYKQSMTKIDAMKSQISDPEGVAKLDSLKAQMQQDLAAKQMQATEGFNIKAISESKPIVLPTAKQQADASTAFEDYVAKTPLKEATSSYEALQLFKESVKAGATPQAIANFIAAASGLGQGSYGPMFEKMLSDMGLVDRTVAGITEFFAGNKPEPVVRAIENFLTQKSIQSGIQAMDYLPKVEQMAQEVGLPRDIYTKRINPAAVLKRKTSSLGLRPEGVK